MHPMAKTQKDQINDNLSTNSQQPENPSAQQYEDKRCWPGRKAGGGCWSGEVRMSGGQLGLVRLGNPSTCCRLNGANVCKRNESIILIPKGSLITGTGTWLLNDFFLQKSLLFFRFCWCRMYDDYASTFWGKFDFFLWGNNVLKN